MTDKTDQRLAEIEARAEAATEGPWYDENVSEKDVRPTGWSINIGGSWDMVLGDYGNREPNHEDDARFIAHARTDIPYLLAKVRELRGENERLRHHLVRMIDDQFCCCGACACCKNFRDEACAALTETGSEGE